MARGRSSGTGYAVALIIFAGLFLITAILAIVFYTKIEAADSARDDAIAQLNEFAPTSVRSDPRVQELSQERPANGIVGELLQEREDLSAVIDTAAGGAPLDIIREKFEAIRPSGSQVSTYVGLVNDLNSDISTLQDQVDAANQRIQVLSQETQTLTQARDAALEEVAVATRALSDGAQANQEDLNRLAAGIDGQFTALSEGASARETELTNDLATANDQIRELNDTLALLQVRLNTLVPNAGNPAEPLFGTIGADGTIADYYADDAITINRGSKDLILPGMTFEVFEPGENITIDADGLATGKGRIEVVTVNDTNAVCRLVEVEVNQQVNVGDQIVNLVYDPDMTFSFLVFGDFDLDNTGRASIADRRRIEGMIDRWGGEVMEGDLARGESTALNSPAGRFTYEPPLVPATLDFIVLGAEPQLPADVPDPATALPDAIRAWNDAFAKLQEYQDIVAQARSLGVPVLNQNRFLRLVGFYRR